MKPVTRIFYHRHFLLNGLAGVGALIALANTLLAWLLYGTTRQADMWMLVLAMAQAFNLLSQLGVEQFPIFSAEQRALGAASGKRFDRAALSWSMLSGVLFAGSLSLIAPWLIDLFATGFDADEQRDALRFFYPLLLQVCVAPSIFVIRQQMLLDDRKLLATMLGWSLGAVQLVVLIYCVTWSTEDAHFLSVGTGVLSLVFGGIILWFWSGSQVFRKLPEFETLWPFIKASVTMRFTHSIHNFFVVLLTNNALSAGSEGTLSVLQYVKRIADGLVSVSFAPHAAVFHALQSEAWAKENKAAFFVNVRAYLQTSFAAFLGLLLIGGMVLVAAMLWGGNFPAVLSNNNVGLFALMLAWQLTISVETIPVGVIMMAKHSLQIFGVNAIYLAILFFFTRFLMISPISGLQIGGALLASQLLSLCLFTWLATHLFRMKYR